MFGATGSTLSSEGYFTGCPIGGGFIWYGLPSKIPSNCRICDNTTLLISEFAKLHENLGGAWGNDGTNLNLPDLRGRFPRGVDGAAGNDPDKLTRTAPNAGGNSGNAVGSIQGDEIFSHSHYSGVKHDTNNDTVFDFGYNQGTGNALGGYTLGTTNRKRPNTSNSGGNETRPKNANVYFVIRVS